MKSFRASLLLVSAMLILSYGLSATSLTGPAERIALIHHIPSDSSSPPTIEWFGPPENSTEGMTICWDGIYDGQTEEVWDFDIWVNDTDGVDSVIFRFLCGSSSEWENKTAELVEGNSIRGLYAGNLTYTVEWNSTSGYPVSEYNVISFKVFANDSLGNWAETTTITYMGGYVIIYPPTTNGLINEPYGWLLLTVVVAAIVGVAVVALALHSRRM